MNSIKHFLEYIINLNQHIDEVMRNYGFWAYTIFFSVIFSETAFVVTSFLPGDSLVFAVGAISRRYIKIHFLVLGFIVAATLGDNLNHLIGRVIGKKLTYNDSNKIFKKKYIDSIKNFISKYGEKVIIISRFVPTFRSLVPFVAGIIEMDYKKFVFYNAIGCAIWSRVWCLGGYYFGKIPYVRNHFGLIGIAVVGVTILPALIGFIYNIFKNKNKK